MRFPGPPKTWNDWLALLVIVGVPVMWVWGNVNEMISGASIAGWTLVLQFYYRKSQGELPKGS